MKHASWVHGNAVKLAREGFSLSTQYTGWGAVIQTHGAEWFHFTVPTPVIVNGQRASIEKLFVMFSTTGTARITAVHVWDGPDMIQGYDNLSIAGDHSKDLDAQNTWLPQARPMRWGIDISVCVDFGPPSNIAVPQITFTAAGADFQTP